MCWWWHRSDGLESLQESQQKKQEAASAKAGSKEAEGKAPRHNLNWTVHLLAACRKDELDKLEKLQGVPRCVAMYRLAPYSTHSVHVAEMKSGNVHMTCVESENMRLPACVMMHTSEPFLQVATVLAFTGRKDALYKHRLLKIFLVL